MSRRRTVPPVPHPPFGTRGTAGPGRPRSREAAENRHLGHAGHVGQTGRWDSGTVGQWDTQQRPHLPRLLRRLDSLAPAARINWLMETEEHLVQRLIADGVDADAARNRILRYLDQLVQHYRGMVR
jgi:hypothetical protein